VDRAKTDPKPGRRHDRLRDGVGNIMKFKVKENIASGIVNTIENRRPESGEEFQPDFVG
jgi:hypothetical protein